MRFWTLLATCLLGLEIPCKDSTRNLAVAPPAKGIILPSGWVGLLRASIIIHPFSTCSCRWGQSSFICPSSHNRSMHYYSRLGRIVLAGAQVASEVETPDFDTLARPFDVRA